MMKRNAIRILALVLALSVLAGCSGAVGGSYRLSKTTGDGYSISPSDLGMNISFTLESDGTGRAVYNSTELDITWSQDGKTVTLMDKDEKKVLELTVSGGNLILYDEGTALVFERQEDKD